MKYLWSKSNAAFFSASDVSEYVAAGWNLDDAVEVECSVFAEYSGQAPHGKMRGVGVDGMPCWVDVPPLPHHELVAQADSRKSLLMSEVESEIKPLERANRLAIATDEELALLESLERYSVLLMRVDTSLAPNIEWPQKPQ